MAQSRWRFVRNAAIFAALTAGALSCGSSDSDSLAGDDGAIGSGSDASGELFVSGSSTVEPISVRVAELFEDIAPDVFVDVEGPGTGDGFKKFCAGETDISDASRKIKESEADECAAAGIDYTEVLVGVDGIGVMTNNSNDAVDCVTFENLYGLIGPEAAGVVDTWADANAIAGDGMPDVPLDVFGPGAESGTYDSFVEIVIEDIADERGQSATTRSDYNPSANDNVILQGIESSDTSLGWVGYAYAADADVKLLDVDGGDGCVAPTPETIASNEYPISRNLYIYVNNANAAENPALRAYVDFYVSTGLDEAVESVGYVELSESSKDSVRAAWNG